MPVVWNSTLITHYLRVLECTDHRRLAEHITLSSQQWGVVLHAEVRFYGVISFTHSPINNPHPFFVSKPSRLTDSHTGLGGIVVWFVDSALLEGGRHLLNLF